MSKKHSTKKLSGVGRMTSVVAFRELLMCRNIPEACRKLKRKSLQEKEGDTLITKDKTEIGSELRETGLKSGHCCLASLKITISSRVSCNVF